MRTLVVQREVACPPEVALPRIYRALGAATAHQATRVLSVPFEDLHLPKVGALQRAVVITVGEPTHNGALTRIPLSWRVPGSNAFPVFSGRIEVQPLATYLIELQLSGYYRAPYGLLGALFDELFGRKIAEATIWHVMDDISVAIETPPDALQRGLRGGEQLPTTTRWPWVTDPNWAAAEAYAMSAPSLLNHERLG